MSARSFSFVALLTLAPVLARAQLVHEPIVCMVSGQFPLVDASVEPTASVSRARVYFKAKSRPARYFVEMQLHEGRLVAKLPKPRLEDKAIHYSVRASVLGVGDSRTGEIEARVVSDESECPAGSRVAPTGRAGEVIVFDAATGKVGKWPSFRGH